MKQIVITKDFNKHGIDFKKDCIYDVKVIQYGVTGGFNRYPQDNTMDGDLHWEALVEFDSGRIIPFEIGYEIIIIKQVKYENNNLHSRNVIGGF
jgi:hypothetical protein